MSNNYITFRDNVLYDLIDAPCVDLDDFVDKGKRDIHRYFPFTWKSHIHDEYSSSAGVYELKINVPWQVRLLSRFEDIDFLSPLIANIIALALWAFYF